MNFRHLLLVLSALMRLLNQILLILCPGLPHPGLYIIAFIRCSVHEHQLIFCWTTIVNYLNTQSGFVSHRHHCLQTLLSFAINIGSFYSPNHGLDPQRGLTFYKNNHLNLSSKNYFRKLYHSTYTS